LKRALALLFVSLAVLSFSPTRCFAAESQGYLFSVKMIPTINQIGNAGYYHIPGKPGEQIPLQAQLTNNTNQPLELKVVPMNAYSSQDGIFYQSPLEVNSQAYTLVDEEYGLAQYISETNPITLQPNQSEVVSFSIAVPELSTGTMLGSIRFIAFVGTQEIQKADEKNKYAQMLIDKYQAIDTAIQIDLPQTVQPSISVGNATFNGDLIGISVAIMNQAAIIQENITGTYEIRDHENIFLFAGVIPAFKMAPLTEFQYPLSWQYKILESGTYTLSLKIAVNGEESSLEKTFAVNQQGIAKAQQAQAKINPYIKAGFPEWLSIVIVLVILISIIFFIRYLRVKKHSLTVPRAEG